MLDRFYKDVTVAPVDVPVHDPVHNQSDPPALSLGVLLDGRPVRTPAKGSLWSPSVALAEAMANEWREQKETIDLGAMPLTQISSAAIDRVAPRRSEVIDDLAQQARSDLVFYRAEAPEELVRLQTTHWQPVVDWVTREFNANFVVTAGVMPVSQSDAAVSAMAHIIGQKSDYFLAALSLAASASKSLLLAMALAERRLALDDVATAAMLDEDFQAARWGEEEEAKVRRAALVADLKDADRFFSLLNQA